MYSVCAGSWKGFIERLAAAFILRRDVRFCAAMQRLDVCCMNGKRIQSALPTTIDNLAVTAKA